MKENGTPIILYGRLYTKYETVISEVDTFVDVQPNSVYSTGHEVIVPASGETAEDISRASFVAKSGILLGGDLNIIVPDDYINPVFLALTISNGNQQKELSKRAQGKSVVHIHNSDLENVVLLYPKYEEQEKIGEYFSKLDTLITLHQRKLEKLKELKKGLVQKLFSQEVRFKADDGSDYPNWKTKKIGDVCTQIKETIDPMANPKKLFVEYSMPAFDNEMKPEVVYGNTMNSIRKVIGSPCVLINKLNVRKRRIWNIVNPEDNAVCSAEFVPLTSEVMNLSFVAYFALTDWFTRYLLECSTGSSNSQKRVTPDVILNIKMPIPCLAEQQKIVDCLSSLDHVIEKQKVTLAAWKELKKGLLQQMFV